MTYSKLIATISEELRRTAQKCEGREGVLAMDFVATNGRRFRVTKERSGEHYAFEMTPRIQLEDRQGLKKMMRSDPNGFHAVLRDEGIKPLVWMGGGYHSDILLWSSLADVSEYIATAITDNVFCDGIDPQARSDLGSHPLTSPSFYR